MRVALHTRLKPGAEAAYERAHSEVPPELVAAIREAGVREWMIWRSGKENSWFMPMKKIIEAGPRNDAYLDFIDARASDPATASENIEAVSYLPDVFFAHDRNETAWKWMEHVYDPPARDSTATTRRSRSRCSARRSRG